jgi:hypothetical protein
VSAHDRDTRELADAGDRLAHRVAPPGPEQSILRPLPFGETKKKGPENFGHLQRAAARICLGGGNPQQTSLIVDIADHAADERGRGTNNEIHPDLRKQPRGKNEEE